MTKDILDPEIVRRIKALGGDRLLSDLVGMFLEHTPERLAEFRRGVESGDCERAEKAIHSFRSSSVSLGACAEADEAADLERLARQGKTAVLRDRLPGFETVVEQLLSGLRTLQQGGGA